MGPALKDNHLLLNRTIHWGWRSVWNSLKPFKIAKLPTLSFSQESPDSWLTWSWCHVNTTTQPWNWSQLIARQVKFGIGCHNHLNIYLWRYVLSLSMNLKKKKVFTEYSILLMLSSFFFILHETRLIEPRMKKVWGSQIYVTQLRVSSWFPWINSCSGVKEFRWKERDADFESLHTLGE